MDYLDLIDAVQSAVDGVLFGTTYALLGIGFTLIFGVMHKINLSYAAASIGAAYASLLVLAAFKAPAIVVFIIAAIAGGAIGAASSSPLSTPTLHPPPCGEGRSTERSEGDRGGVIATEIAAMPEF